MLALYRINWGCDWFLEWLAWFIRKSKQFNKSDIITVRNEVAKVMFLQVSVCPQGGVVRGVPGPRGSVSSRGVPGPGGCLIPGGVCFGSVPGHGGVPGPRGLVSQHALRQTPPGRNGYCCIQYASYWNAFLLLAASQHWLKSSCKRVFMTLIQIKSNLYVHWTINPHYFSPLNQTPFLNSQTKNLKCHNLW